jgi:hypothetical protein
MADGQTLYGEVTLDALKSKSILATDANGVIIEAADFVTFDTTNDRVGIGTTTPESLLNLVSELTASPILFIDNYYSSKASGNLIGRKARGTVASPTKVLSGDQLFLIGGRGYLDTGTFSDGSSPAKISFFAEEDFNSATNMGSGIKFFTTEPAGTVIGLERMRITGAGEVRIPFDLVVGGTGQLSFGAAQDAYIGFDGNSLNIVANAVTSTDTLDITAFGITLSDACNIILNTTTGTKIGTATGQKLGFYNATPVDQPAAVADSTDAASVILRLNELVARMRELGLIAT